MHVNQTTIDLIKKFEGFRENAYRDSAGVLTIGYGTTARAGVGLEPHEGMTITEIEAEYYLGKAIEKFAAEISEHIKAPINENQFGAFVSLAYNIGPSAFKKSSCLRHFNAGSIVKAADSILLWNKAGGKKLKGLTRRREAERELFLTPPPVQPKTVIPSKNRKSPASSTTIRSSVVGATSAATGVFSALSSLDPVVQYIVIITLAISLLSFGWIIRERLKKWAEGIR